MNITTFNSTKDLQSLIPFGRSQLLARKQEQKAIDFLMRLPFDIKTSYVRTEKDAVYITNIVSDNNLSQVIGALQREHRSAAVPIGDNYAVGVQTRPTYFLGKKAVTEYVKESKESEFIYEKAQF